MSQGQRGAVWVEDLQDYTQGPHSGPGAALPWQPEQLQAWEWRVNKVWRKQQNPAPWLAVCENKYQTVSNRSNSLKDPWSILKHIWNISRHLQGPYNLHRDIWTCLRAPCPCSRTLGTISRTPGRTSGTWFFLKDIRCFQESLTVLKVPKGEALQAPWNHLNELW